MIPDFVYKEAALDEKLRELLNGLAAPYGIQDSSRIADHVEKVKKAFADVGYEQRVLGRDFTARVNLAEVMTGQEFYDRFEKEITGWSMGAYGRDLRSVLLAAKKASGLNE